ncbi:MAG: WYL domain-containing protein [Bacteroidota bacterium]|nr:WYL domain-containing protein [Bacteroidota bacterium]
MLEQLAKIKRQIEIVGLCAERDSHRSVADFADMYGCDELTIKRDLTELRAQGVDIHSGKGRGIYLATPLDLRQTRMMVGQYLAMTLADSAIDKATNAFVQRLRARSLALAVMLRRCIEHSRMAVIDYQKEAGEIETSRVVWPLLLFQSDGLWRLLAVNDGVIKQYHLTKVLRFEETAKRFSPVPPEEIEAMFRHSFRSWIGRESHRVRIKLSPTWVKRLKPHLLIESQIVHEDEDGSVVFETIVNCLEEIAAWIVSRGEGVTVLEPEELKRKVLDLAQGAMRNYAP